MCFTNIYFLFLCAGEFSHVAPQFLEPVVLEIVLAGKSMEMLQDLGKLAEVIGHHDICKSYLYEKSSLPIPQIHPVSVCVLLESM